ncbi:MAG TPA: patatin family protein [Candidatus Eisenbergiella stercorigallinarum]|uniref:Patatin family protein n=1 Tax=Candidatus Eisenbergiella stercorigallinarum TaxID=2838557 RepID=A0A9D2U0Z6_9FIRM|nr:patatin family protein [Candidatus Eisenbergiella stercorigallinarum]
MYQAGLVLEGGGMKGIYTAGVLDFFLDKGIEFSSCYGVSAGACHLCSFLSKQRGRAYDISVDYLDDPNYCSVSSLLRTGDLFGVKMCYDDIPNRLNPYDYKAFDSYRGRAFAVVTNIVTGQPEYLRLRDMHKDIAAVRASAFLPLVSRKVEIGGKLYLDGGLSDSVPILRSILDGNRKNVVVLTKEVGYRREPSKHLELIRIRYAKYPKIYELMKNRHVAYNRMLDYLAAQEENGQAFVIRPQKKSGVGRVEKDKEKLRLLYEEGYREAGENYGRLMAYLEEKG